MVYLAVALATPPASAKPYRGNRMVCNSSDSFLQSTEDLGAEYTPELREQEERLRKEIEAKN
jgi:hypothetical protein